MEKMKNVPTINPISKMLALVNRGLVVDRDRDSLYRHSPRQKTPIKNQKPPVYRINLQDDTTMDMEYEEIEENPGRKADFYLSK